MEYESLNQSQIEKKHRLEVLKFKRKHNSDDKEKIEKQLLKLSTNWSNYPIPEIIVVNNWFNVYI